MDQVEVYRVPEGQTSGLQTPGQTSGLSRSPALELTAEQTTAVVAITAAMIQPWASSEGFPFPNNSAIGPRRAISHSTSAYAR